MAAALESKPRPLAVLIAAAESWTAGLTAAVCVVRRVSGGITACDSNTTRMPLRSPAPTRILLQYPNGRAHETALDRQVRLGDQFELYGRTWTAVGAKEGRRREGRAPRLVCVPADPAPNRP